MRAEMERVERIRRGDPLTLEEEARIRTDTRRLAIEAKVRHDEWNEVQGFPFYPTLVIPILTIVVAFLIGALGLWVGMHIR